MAQSTTRKANSVFAGSFRRHRTNKTIGSVMRNSKPMKGIRDAAEKNVIISNSLINGLLEDNKFVFAKGITCAEMRL